MSKPRRAPRRAVNGVLLLDKPIGFTSNAALQKVRWLFNAEKGGHTGTLDPLATGLLPLCLGEATKFSSELLDADKTYIATLKLGVTTTTADAEGDVLLVRPVKVSAELLTTAMRGFVGEIAQIPPMFSALKRDGKPLYEYARQGIEVERAARLVTIYQITVLSFVADEVVIEVKCSKGTYIRTLAADIGEMLGCGAHLSALRRTTIGKLTLLHAVTVAVVETLPLEQRDKLLAPSDTLLEDLPLASLNETEEARVLHGQGVRWNGEEGQRWRLYGPSKGFIGLGETTFDGWLNPRRLIAGGA